MIVMGVCGRNIGSWWGFLGAFLAVGLTSVARGDDVDQRINSIVAGMSQTEKIGQTALRGEPSSSKGELSDEVKRNVRQGRIGAFLNVMDKKQVEELQRIAPEESPHK